MATARASASVNTSAKVVAVNITDEVRRALRAAALRQGIAVVSAPHTTCSVCVNEDEAGLKDDLTRMAALLTAAVEPQGGFRHDRIDNNARAHLTAVLVGSSATVPIVDGELALGTWQSVFLLEMDGPRTRTVTMTFLGD